METLITDPTVFVWTINCKRKNKYRDSSTGNICYEWRETYLHCVARNAQDALDMLKALDPDALVKRVSQEIVCGLYPGVLIDKSVLPVVSPPVAPSPARVSRPKQAKRRKKT